MPFASMSNVTSICGRPRGAGGMSVRLNWPSDLLPAPRGLPQIEVTFDIDANRSEEHTSELQSPMYIVCVLLLRGSLASLLPLPDALPIFAGGLVFGRDVKNAVRVDVERDLDLRQAARRRRDVGEVELAERLVAGAARPAADRGHVRHRREQIGRAHV